MIRVLLLALLLSGCATTRTVPTACIAKDQKIPDEPGPVKDRLTGRADADIRVVVGSLLRWQDYGRGLREVVETCRER